MPEGMMVPGQNMSPVSSSAMLGRTGGLHCYSPVTLRQYLMDGQHQHQIPMLQPQYENHGQQQQQAATSESDAHGKRQDELTMESQAGSDNMESGGAGSGSAGEELQEELGLQRPRKKRYHRHTQHQIQELEAFFKQCPHPDEKQRRELSRELGLEPLQVKFWFQNKRTQMKTQLERTENSHLREENDRLRAENARYKEALANATCPNCGAAVTSEIMSLDEQHLRLENARLRDEVDRVSSIAAGILPPSTSTSTVSFSAAAPSSYPPPPPLAASHHHLPGGGDMLALTNGSANGIDKPLVIELAVAAMDELVKMAQLGDPLWVPTVVDGVATETLNEEEYARSFFPRGMGPKSPELRSEASRETVIVVMNHVSLVEMLMDVNQWRDLFSTIVSRASTLQAFSTAVAGNYNGALQLMSAEFQLPSPLVPTREAQFVRYCKHHPDDGSWAVVDVSVDGLVGLGPPRGPLIRRRPSGCVIRPLPYGHSRVTWVEHAESSSDAAAAVPDLYLPLTRSALGLAFGAPRWAAALARQCHRLATVISSSSVTSSSGVVVVMSAEGRRSVMRLAARMTASFCAGVAASSAHQWTTLSSRSGRSGVGGVEEEEEEEEEKEEEVRVTTRKSVDDPGRPPGVILNAATSFRLPVPPAKVFGFLRDDATRGKWDILSNGGDVQEVARVATGRRDDDDDQGNAVSLLRVNNVNSGQSSNDMMLILQECVTDAAGSYVVYAPVDVAAMTVVLAAGGDPDYVPLLPSGFAILPDGDGDGNDGSLLTVAFQILVDSAPTARLSLGSVATVNSLIACTVDRIKAAVVVDGDDKQAAPPPAAWPIGDQAAAGAS
ncbi:hypothetical protein PR202_gb28873 [Eleusine coracana subsp. coracana]|uniref:Uncharacterized protein n=1 Tax=Eleusine coracana subsp. coracana TaxID=191504 RepID=A0AAV5FXI8_ELECO|nr:hypothetical protein PR202_gb28873 [Eleusine coracana subsp. coracana]